MSDKVFNLKDMNPSHIFKENNHYTSIHSESNSIDVNEFLN